MKITHIFLLEYQFLERNKWVLNILRKENYPKMLINSFYPLPNEMLFSWLFRLSWQNASDYRTFVTMLTGGDYLDSSISIDRFYLPKIFKSLPNRHSLKNLFLNCTLYSLQSPFLATELQTKLLSSYFYPVCLDESSYEIKKTYGNPLHFESRKIYDNPLRFCPECFSEEMDKYGFFWFSRLHQIPLLTHCATHKCLLRVYTGKFADWFKDPMKNSRECSEIRDISAENTYFKFTKSLIDLCPDMNADITRGILFKKFRDLNLYDPEQSYKGLASEIRKNGFDTIINPADTGKYLTRFIFKPNMKITWFLPLLSLLYPDFNDFKNDIQNGNSEAAKTIQNGEYIVIGKAQNNISEYACKCCGTRFCETTDAIASGFTCPECSKSLSPDILIKQVIENIDNNEYKMVSEFHGMDHPIKVRHLCGSEQEYDPGQFIFSPKRCQCKNRNTDEKLKALINSAEFEFINYEDKVLTLKHKTCGKIFKARLAIFLSHPYCRKCETTIYSKAATKIIPIGRLPASYINENANPPAMLVRIE